MLRTLEHAGCAGIPVLFLGVAGAVLQLEEPRDFGAYAAVIGAAVRVKGVVPRIAIKQGNDGAYAMDMAMVSDFIVNVRGGSEDPSGVRHGTGVVVRNRAEAVTFTRRILACVAGGNRSVRSRPATSFEELWRAAPLPFGKTDPREVIEAVVDGGSSLELMAGTGPSLITLLVRLEERPVGVIAHDVLVGGGALTSDAVEKGTRMTRLCSRWGMPLLVLVHAPEPATTATDIGRQEGGLLHAFAATQVPRVIGRTANATRWIMNPRATGATAVLAWPDPLGRGEQASIDAVITPTRTRNVVSTLLGCAGVQPVLGGYAPAPK
ncbi:carboxyl transferase domain-containing protein [Streptomyces mirabilis]|uniref:carboxyl transferase domain-containing protein n=1 Tax=Streptomyces mirabilis TaxID=68239 RepID=UPI00332C6E8A